MTLDDYRLEFELATNRSLSMPLAGAIVWLVVALLSTQVSDRTGVLILLFCSGLIFPLALAIAKIRHENFMVKNPLGKLSLQSVIMVNLLWAVHIPLFLLEPRFVPLSLGIGLGLHWMIYSWVVQNPVGTIHALLRTVLVLLAWSCFPDQRLLAVGMAVVMSYAISLWQMSTRLVPLRCSAIGAS
jgi:hypothetical protein